jgi:hypothetical protein
MRIVRGYSTNDTAQHHGVAVLGNQTDTIKSEFSANKDKLSGLNATRV